MRGLALGDDLSVLLKSLKHSDAEVRRSAAIALENFGAEAAAAVPVLTQALDDADVVTQVAVTRTLGQIGLAALPGLLQALGKPEQAAVWQKKLDQTGEAGASRGDLGIGANGIGRQGGRARLGRRPSRFRPESSFGRRSSPGSDRTRCQRRYPVADRMLERQQPHFLPSGCSGAHSPGSRCRACSPTSQSKRGQIRPPRGQMGPQPFGTSGLRFGESRDL